MGMNLNGPIYLQRKGLLTPEKNKILDIGPQTIYFVRDEQIREFVKSQGSTASDSHLEDEVRRLIYFSTPRPEERTTMFSEITDLTNIEYHSIDVCPGLKNTEILDLNFDPLPAHLMGHHDVVFNFGTTEHIFNQWNCFEVMHDATKVGGVIYHQLPASGYFDHGYYCYTPLFFREMAQANGYEVIDLFVTPAGDSKVDALQIPARNGENILVDLAHLAENNRIPALNIHVILKRTTAEPFRCGLEIATAHAPVDQNMAARYGDGRAPKSAAVLQRLLDEATHKLSELQRSRSWRMTAPIRYIRGLMS
jgi:hypothetical protein